ncbi:hypothetical protein MSG28_007367 [Choristoneura fumiferana]|uniref:Uncharacterized protein n=1 Tax=Choristoneura fumiferana TaxID=7141 RepID=A0ACC0JWN7_CHOFU|nr:hypothetical protein MSG28_007367 [Choristoneura fumiferana]
MFYYIYQWISNDVQQLESLVREKRQMETFEDNEFSAPQQAPEESGFWDRVISVALKLFSKFVEWLNT